MVVRPFIEFQPDQPANLICLGLLFSNDWAKYNWYRIKNLQTNSQLIWFLLVF